MSISLESSDSRLSPIIDAQRVSAILVSNRVDAPIADYTLDNRVMSIEDDPNAFQYISGENTLENSATSIKILYLLTSINSVILERFMQLVRNKDLHQFLNHSLDLMHD